MIILLLIIIPVFLILVQVVLHIIVRRYGKFSYDGFSAAGFAYNPEKDIFYATRNAWQKKFGYTHLYDVLAPVFRMIIDTEPVKFYYNNKNWLITFWKGQYGIVTGAEIGIYCTKQQNVNKKTVYLPANDNEMLNMSFILYKNGEIITKVSAQHWWLAIFKLGMFSWPKELSTDINITFPNHEMLEAFLNSFKKLGYSSKNFTIIDNTFCFKYKKPRTRKVWTRTWLLDKIRQFWNRKNTKLYNKYLIDLIDDNGIDDSKTKESKKLVMVNEFLPDIIKNSKEVQNSSKQEIGKMDGEKENNLVLLHSDVYSEIKAKRL